MLLGSCRPGDRAFLLSKTNGLTWYDAEQFRHNVLQKRTLAEPYAVRKSLATAKEIPNDASRTIRFVISSSAEDRDKDVVNVAGWNLDNYKKNSVVMWGHDYKSLPVAKCTSILPRGDKLVAEAQFPSADLYPFADTVYRMLKGGYLNATSVGFRPLKFEPNEKRGGLDYNEQELLEFSVVPIPSNQEALVEARAAGIDLAPIKQWAEGILIGWHGDGLWVKKAEVEKLRTSLADLVAKPLPSPNDDEEQDHFISRCMGNPTMNEDYPENDQRAAVCHSQWRRHQEALVAIQQKIKAEHDHDCPKGDQCPMHRDMTSCPEGKDCPMGKAVAARNGQLSKAIVIMGDGPRPDAEEAYLYHSPTLKIPWPKGLTIEQVLDKRGRVLSSRNEERLRQALTNLNDILAELQPEATEQPEGPARGPAGEEVVLHLTDACAEAVLELAESKPDGYEVDEDELRQALMGVLQAALKDQVRVSVGAAIAAARGRVT